MAGIGGIDRGAVALATAVALVVMGVAPPPAAADEPASQVLPGPATGTVVADLDGDGVTDVARLTRDAQDQLVVDVWRLDGAAWLPVDARLVPVERDADEPGHLPPAPDASGLMRWRHDGRDELLLMTARLDTASEFGQLCCLAVWRVSLMDGRLQLRSMGLAGRSFESAHPLDLDGDGTDELVTMTTRYEDIEDHGTTVIEIIRWNGEAWVTEWRDERGSGGYGFAVGETDGRPGAEVIIGPSEGELIRIADRGGEIVEQRGRLDASVGREAWMAGLANGDLVIVASNGVHLARWPVGGSPSVLASARMSTYPSVQIVGDGSDAVLLVQTPDEPYGPPEPRVDVYDLSLERLGSVRFDPSVLMAWQRGMLAGGLWTESGRPLFPHIGPVPGFDGFAAGGTLVRPDGRGGYATEPFASLIGTPVVGVAGRDGEWAVLGGFGSFGGSLFLYSGFRGEPIGRLTLVPFDQLRGDRPELAGRIELRGAVEIGGEAGTMTVAADGATGFTVVVTAQPGTAVAHFEQVPRVHEVGDEPLEIVVRPHRSGDEDLPFERDLLIMSATGHASLVQLRGTFIRNPPELSAAAKTELFAMRASVSGRASSGATVTVDGQAVETTHAGRFEAAVDAPIWPRTILVTARDPLGNETTKRLEVVGVVDYRGLPWLAIVAVLTIGVGAAMFLRAPRRRPLALAIDGDGRLEELDGDEV